MLLLRVCTRRHPVALLMSLLSRYGRVGGQQLDPPCVACSVGRFVHRTVDTIRSVEGFRPQNVGKCKHEQLTGIDVLMNFEAEQRYI